MPGGRRAAALVAGVALLAAAGIVLFPSGSKHRRPTVLAQPHSAFTGCASRDCKAYAIQLRWSNIPFSGTTGYYLFVNGSKVGSASDSPYVFQGMNCGTTVTLGLEAYDRAGNHSRLYTTSYTTPSCGCPRTARNTPGGPDPWGGCFPGPGNTGVPSNVKPVDVSDGDILPGNPAIPADNAGWGIYDRLIYMNTANAVVDGVEDLNGVYLQGGNGGTIKNSYIGDINDNTTGGKLLVQEDTINGGGGSSSSPVNSGTGMSTIDVEGVNAYNGKDGVHCLGTCNVTDSWLHDNVSNDPSSHQQGIYLNGGSDDVFTHNSIGCISNTGCTANVSILNAGPDINISVSKNLLLSSSSSLGGKQTGYCVYPGANAAGSWPQISGIAWTDNVFQRGSGRCALNGPVYGWFPSLCSPVACTWTGNTWDDGSALEP